MRACKVVLMLVCVCLSGCATIISGKRQNVFVTSDPPGATVTADSGMSVVTPGKINLKRKHKHLLTASLPGYEAMDRHIGKKLNGWIFAGVLWDFGIFSIPTDLITGAANTLTPGEVHFHLTAEGK